MTIQLVHLQRPAQGAPVQKFNLAQAQLARNFHSSIPGYAPTPLVNLPKLAASLGVVWTANRLASLSYGPIQGGFRNL